MTQIENIDGNVWRYGRELLTLQAKKKNDFMIERTIAKEMKNQMNHGKVISLMGARQTGKTTLIREMVSKEKGVVWLNADEAAVRNVLSDVSVAKFRSILGNNKILVIDEALRIEDIGIKMKLVTDSIDDVQVILTGSSSFELSNKINEPLTGRKREFRLYPLSFGEMAHHHGTMEELHHLNMRLVYGSYPEVVCSPGNERTVLMQLADSYLYKDILEWEKIKKSDRLTKLLQALAFQVGSEVSYTEIGRLVGLDNSTVEKYITLLEQAYVIFRVGSWSKNLRNELKFAKKVYFYDNGIRNAVIQNFADTSLRQDIGALWENYMVSELRKKIDYDRGYGRIYFWRTTTNREIDFLEENDGKISAYEFKWNPAKKAKKQDEFLKAYPNATLETITPDNYFEYL